MSPGFNSKKQDTQNVPLQRYPNLYLKLNTPKGSRGVYSTTPIPSGTILDTSPVLILCPSEYKRHIEHTSLQHYTYNWPLQPTNPSNRPSQRNDVPPPETDGDDDIPPPTTTTQAFVLGLGSMFNHSRHHQNVGWTRDVDRQVIVYRALRDIAVGEELCISYGDHLTFVDVDGARGRDSGYSSEGNEGGGRGGEEALLRIEL